jgi:hypothetical protein
MDLFKYQHVGPWYIVACPNAAEPFDFDTKPCSSCRLHDKAKRRAAAAGRGDNSFLKTRASYSTDMALLAQQLVQMASKHGFELQVGIHSGCAAGAVLGRMRAFYCLYGDTVNMASRLCKEAEGGQIHCSEGYLQCLQKEMATSAQLQTRGTLDSIHWTSRGLVSMKGFSKQTETFVVSVVNSAASLSPDSEHPARDARTDEESYNVDAFGMSICALSRTNSTEVDSNPHCHANMPSDPIDTLEDMGQEGKEDGLSIASLESSNLQFEHEFMHDKNMLEFTSLARCARAAAGQDPYREQRTKFVRRRMGAAVIFHLLGVVFQHQFALYPTCSYDLDALGPDLSAAYGRLQRLLQRYLTSQILLCLALGLGILGANRQVLPERWTTWMSLVIGTMRVSWILVSIYAHHLWPVKQYTLTFPLLFSILQFTVVSMNSFRHTVVLFFVCHVLYVCCMIRMGDMVNAAFVVRFLGTSYTCWLFLVWAEDAQRKLWRIGLVFQMEMKVLVSHTVCARCTYGIFLSPMFIYAPSRSSFRLCLSCIALPLLLIIA